MRHVVRGNEGAIKTVIGDRQGEGLDDDRVAPRAASRNRCADLRGRRERGGSPAENVVSAGRVSPTGNVETAYRLHAYVVECCPREAASRRVGEADRAAGTGGDEDERVLYPLHVRRLDSRQQRARLERIVVRHSIDGDGQALERRRERRARIAAHVENDLIRLSRDGVESLGNSAAHAPVADHVETAVALGGLPAGRVQPIDVAGVDRPGGDRRVEGCQPGVAGVQGRCADLEAAVLELIGRRKRRAHHREQRWKDALHTRSPSDLIHDTSVLGPRFDRGPFFRVGQVNATASAAMRFLKEGRRRPPAASDARSGLFGMARVSRAAPWARFAELAAAFSGGDSTSTGSRPEFEHEAK